MAQVTTKDLTTLPVGRLGLIPLISCSEQGYGDNSKGLRR